jgi:hypothetical protein
MTVLGIQDGIGGEGCLCGGDEQDVWSIISGDGMCGG